MRFLLFPILLFPIFAAAQNPLKPLPKKGKLNLLVHPADQLLCEDEPIIFRALAACPPPELPRYQWQISANGIHWDDLKNETNPTFSSLGLAKRAHNASQFRVKVVGAGDSIFSVPAMLTVETGLYFSKNPEKQTVAEGMPIVFEAAAESESGNGVASYTWQRSPYASGVWENLWSENRPILRLNEVSIADNGTSFRLLAHTFNGCDSAVSAPAFLVVAGKPVVSIVPLENALCGGGEANFSVQMQGGTGKEKYQWQVSQTTDGDFEDLPDQKDFTLKLKNISSQMNGWQYRAVVKLQDGTAVATRAGKLTVHGSVTFANHPWAVAVCLGEPVSFAALPAASGRVPDCRWQSSSDGGSSWRDLPAVRGTKFDIANASAEQNGQQFRAVATSGECGEVFSKPALLTVFAPVRFSAQPRDQRASSGGDVVFSADFQAVAGGDYAMSWEWSATGGSSWQFMPGGDGKKLTLRKVSPDMKDYLYRMKVLDRRCGRISYSEPARILLEGR